MALVLSPLADLALEQSETQQQQQQQRYVIPNRRSETFEHQGLGDIYQSKYNYALYQLQMQRAGKLRFARLCYTRQYSHYYMGLQEAFYCNPQTLSQNKKRHKGLVHCEPVLHKAKWRDVAIDGDERLHDPQGFKCAGAFREDGVVKSADADWVPLQTLKSFYHEFLIVDYTAHLRAQLEQHYEKKSVYFIYAVQGGNATMKPEDWATLYQLESLAVRCALVARRDFTRQLHECHTDCTDRTVAHLTTHYHPCAGR